VVSETDVIVAATEPVETVAVTSTPEPITSDACPGIKLQYLGERGNDTEWILDNQSGQSVSLAGIQELSWDAVAKGSLAYIRLGEEILWKGEIGLDDLSSGSILEMSTNAANTIPEGQVVFITLSFAWGDAATIDYVLALELDAGCTLKGAWH
jgi:hypothetical protein